MFIAIFRWIKSEQYAYQINYIIKTGFRRPASS